jgi:peptidoglycan/LPS O-acetylase OafA/YrhL
MRAYLPFIDWMKTVGLGLIVFGHVAHTVIELATPPFYPKQLGVAFFVFATGYTLATERRGPLQAIVARWFEVWAYGLLFALLMTAVGAGILGDANPSDYLPLAGGLNVFFNNFPANPTTWYIGSYLHLLVVWALVLRGRRIGPGVVALCAGVELIARALLVPQFGAYVAYQLFFNWLTALAFGLYAGQRSLMPQSTSPVVGVLFVVLWPVAVWSLGWTDTFPFMTSTLVAAPWNAWLLAVCVTIAYFSYTYSGFALLGRLPDSTVARFFARNTLVIFIGHMPLFYWLEYLLNPGVPFAARVTIEFLACFVGLALVSELIRPALQPVLQFGRTRLVELSLKLTPAV